MDPILYQIFKIKKPFDRPKKSTTDAIKIASKRAIQKTAEATDDLIGNRIADKCFKDKIYKRIT